MTLLALPVSLYTWQSLPSSKSVLEAHIHRSWDTKSIAGLVMNRCQEKNGNRRKTEKTLFFHESLPPRRGGSKTESTMLPLSQSQA